MAAPPRLTLMGLLRMGPPEDLVLALQAQLGINDFIETGTYQGGTVAWAIKHFRRVITIELSPALHAAAVRRFSGQPGVDLLCGNSDTRLGEIVAEQVSPAIFWLDAHWSGLETAGREKECPVLAEVARINTSPAGHVILVDDARLFCQPPPRPHRAEEWPDLAEVVAVLYAGGKRYVVLHDDVLIGVPREAKEFLVSWMRTHAVGPRPKAKGWRFWK